MRFIAWSAGLLLTIASSICVATGPARATIEPEVIRLDVNDGDTLRFVRLSRSQGLSQQRVTDIVQDQRGYLWFATQYGLNRYDGYRFRVFKNQPEDPESLCEVHITALFSDRDGNIWVGCTYSVNRYDPVKEKFVHYPLERQEYARTGAAVRHISQDRAGLLWVSTRRGLYRLDPATRAVKKYVHDPADPFSLSSSLVRFSGEDRSGAFWVATVQGLDQLDRESGRVAVHVPIPELDSFGFHEDREGNFWILQESRNGLSRLDRSALRVVRYSFDTRDSPPLTQTGVSSMLEDRNGTLWLGTLSNGILKFDREKKSFTRYRNDPSDAESLAENRITTLFEDREGHIWSGFHATEPGYFLPQGPAFKKLPFDARNPNNLGEKLINSLYEDRHGALWIGTTGALNRLDRTTGRLKHYDVPGNGITSEVFAISGDPHADAMWIGTGGQGLYRLDTRTGAMQGFRHRPGDPASLSNDWVIYVFHDSRGRLWVGTVDGLNQYDPATRTFRVFRHGDPASAHWYRSITEDAQGMLWVDADGDGIQRLEPETGKFTAVSLPREGASPHLYKRVQALYVDRAGDIWAGTATGLYRYSKTGEIKRYSERDGMPSNTVSCISEDASGDLWMGTSEGLARLDRSRTSFKNYSIGDGLPGPDFTGWSACFRSASGEMFFGGFSGGVAFRPESVRDVEYAPPIAFTGLQLSGVPVEPGPGSPLTSALDYTRSVTLQHDQNSFSISFTSLSFRSPSTNRFRYRLEGVEEHWFEVGGDRRLANYTALRPGQYRFRLQGATSRGPWGEPGLELDIEIKPPWWGTWWFQGILVLSVVAMVIAAYLRRMRSIARQFSVRLDERVNERTRIARELHDSLLQGFQGLMFRLQAVRALLPDRATEAAVMLESAMDGGDRAIAEGRTAVQDLRSNAPATSDLADSLTALGTELTGDAPALSLAVVVEGKPRAVAPLVRDDIYRIAREALRNAVHHAQAKRIEVGLHYTESALILRVRDDGIGIDADVVRAGQRAGHWGLQGMRERAEGFGAKIELWSEHGAGTEIELTVPARIAYGLHAPRRRP